MADLVTEFCRYHFNLGVDKIFVAEYGSDDGSLDLLDPFVRAKQVEIITLPTHHFASYDPSNAILGIIREKKAADWVSFLDPDEFLTGPANLKSLFAEECSRAGDALAVPRHNLIGVGPVSSHSHYLRHLTLKITKTDARTSDPAALLFSPWIFSRLPPKVMISARSELTTVTGEHDVRGHFGPIGQSSSMEILHLPMRSYEAFEGKIECAIKYYAQNPELGIGIGWHWRRWITLFEKGQLREEYDTQFLEASKTDLLFAEGRITPETRLADWFTNQ